MNSILKFLPILMLCMALSGCIGAAIGVVVDTTIAVAKIPFKVGAAVVDVATGDDEEGD